MPFKTSTVSNETSAIIQELTREELLALVLLAQENKGVFRFVDGDLVFTLDGKTIRLAQTDELLGSSQASPQVILDLINQDPATLIVLADRADLVPLTTFDPTFHQGLIEPAIGVSDNLGSRVQITDSGILGTLENPLSIFAIDLEAIAVANLFARIRAGVGADISHLPPLPDEEFVDGILPDRFIPLDRDQVPLVQVKAPSLDDDSYEMAEDTVLTGNLADNDDLPNAGAIFALAGEQPNGATVTIEPDGTFTLVPDAHVSGPITFTYEVTDPASGTTTRAEVTVEIAPVVDAPTIDAPATLITQEDIPVSLASIVPALTDRDGSETLDVLVRGVPDGATLSSGIQISPGVWSVPADDFADLELTPPIDFNGEIELEIIATATENATGDSAQTSALVIITVEAVADPAFLSAPPQTLNEDTPILFGPDIVYTTADADGSESVSNVSVSGLPEGAVLDFMPAPGASVVNTPDGIQISGDPDAIRTTLDTLSLTPDGDNGDDFELTISVSSQDTGGALTVVSTPMSFDVIPIADAPTFAGGDFTTNEDETVALTGLIAELNDTDGSETIAIVISGVPEGANLNGGTDLGDGRFALTSIELAALEFTPPPDAHGDFELTLEVTATENEGADTVTRTAPVAISVIPVADTPNLDGSGLTVTNEDTAAAFGPAITFSTNDRDGSEQISRLELTGFPNPSLVNFLVAPNATVTPVGNGFVITGEADAIRATLDSFQVENPANDASDFTIDIEVEVRDANGDTATQTSTHDIDFVPVADAPVLTGGDFTTPEDTPVPLSELAAELADTDGSETLGTIRISGVPEGASLSDGIQVTPGVWELNASQLDSVSFVPATNINGTFDLTLSAIATDSNGDTQQASIPFSVTVSPVNDVFVLEGGSTSTNEDTPVQFGDQVQWTLGDTDGSEKVTRVEITGLTGDAALTFTPDGGGTVTAILGGFAITGTEAEIRSKLDSFVFDPATHVGDDVTLSVAVTVEEADGTPRTQSTTHTVDVTPITDAPTATGGRFETNEDEAVLLVDVGGMLTDRDGSETIEFLLLGVPAGGSFNVGRDNGDGTFSFTPEEIEDGLEFTPPRDASGTFDMVLRVTANESEGGTPRSSDAAVQVVVAPIADSPDLNTGTTDAIEDEPIAIGRDITFSGNDIDDSENFSLDLSGFPAGSSPVWDTNLPGTVVVAADGTSATLSGTQAEVRALLESFAVVPVEHLAVDFSVAVAVTSIDGSSATTVIATHGVTFTQIADTPSAFGPANFDTQEDIGVDLDGLGGSLVDRDGSEILSFRIENVPPGSQFNAGSDQGNGVWAFTSNELETLRFTPPRDLDGQIDLTLVSVATESDNADVAEATHDFTITVDAQADLPNLTPGESTVNEDQTVVFGDQITYSPRDIDGSEQVTSVLLSGVPNSAIGFGSDLAATITRSGSGTRITGTPEEIRAALDTATYSPATHVGDDANISVTVAVTDRDGSIAQRTLVHSVDVVPVADTPQVNGDSVATDEDVAVSVDLSGALVDRDGSETLSFTLTNVPSGAQFSAGTQNPDGTWTFTPEQLTGLTFTPPPQAHGTFTMQVVATALEAEGDTATSVAELEVVVAPVLDTPVLNDGVTTRNEDQSIPLGADIDLSLADLDGSQTMEITLEGIPSNATVTAGSSPSATLTQSQGNWVISGPAEEALALLDTLRVQPATHDDRDFQVQISVFTQEIDGDDTSVFGTQDVNIRASADAPVLAADYPGSTSTFTGDEDTQIDVPISLALTDTDGTEELQFLDISGIPDGASFLVTPVGGATVTELPSGVVRITGPQAAIVATAASGITITPPIHSDVDITLTATARSEEVNPSEPDTVIPTADSTIDIAIQVNAIADPVTATGGTFNTEEDTDVTLTGLGSTLVDQDGSEIVTYVLTGVPEGASFAQGTNNNDGTWSFTAAQVDGGLSFTPPNNAHGVYDLELQATTTEQNGGDSQSSTAPVRITVDAQADRPLINGIATGNEDTTIVFGDDFNVSLVDTDGSETLTEISLTMPVGEVATFAAQGTAEISVVPSPSGIRYVITGPQADIQSTLDTFAWTPPPQSDEDIIVTVTARTQDVDDSVAARTIGRAIIVRAVADEPDGQALDVSGEEDTAIALDLTALASIDTDGSEVISVRLSSLPEGAVVGGNTAGGASYTLDGTDWIIEAPDLAALNAALETATFTPPENFSGIVEAVMEVISTEQAIGNQVTTKTASVTRPFQIEVNQVPDAPEIRTIDAVAGAAGFEDQPIRLVVDVRLADDDGSEEISQIDVSDIPVGARITDAEGNPLGIDLGNGTVRLTQANLADLHIIAPLNSNENFPLTVSARSTETDQGLDGDGTSEIGTATIDVDVIGVADPANLNNVAISVAEDQPIALGLAAGASLADTDGSETLSFVIEGLPAGVAPSVGTFIGGRWQVDAADMPGLTIPAAANFSGDYVTGVAPDLKVFAITQENDGNQTQVEVPIDITITPVVDGAAWSPQANVNEGDDIPLVSAGIPGLLDDDGSEQATAYTFDLSNVVSDAGISGSVASTQALIDTFISGVFTDNGDGTITVLPSDLAGVALQAGAFTDSNQDFSIPIRVDFTDGAAQSTFDNTLAVNLIGVADTPTVFAPNLSGVDDSPLRLALGGVSTDTDTDLGRPASEEVIYIVSGFDGPGPALVLTDADGDPIGFNNQDGTWLVQADDLPNLHIFGLPNTSGTRTLTLTTVATENDGDVATNATTFDVEIIPSGNATASLPPLPPIVIVNPMVVDEDGTIPLDVDVRPDPDDPTTSINNITVVISDVPPGVTVIGAIFNNVTNTYVTDARTLSEGGVTFSPVADFSGDIDFTIDAISTNRGQQSASNLDNDATIEVVAVADTPSIAIEGSGQEDSAIPLDISLTATDADGSERLREPILVTLSAGTLSAGTDVGGGVWELTLAELSGLTLQPPSDSDDDITVDVEVTAEEPNGSIQTSSSSQVITVDPVADEAILTVENATGLEDSAITLTGLSATLSDIDGSETLSTIISGLPEGSILSAGANNGDGSWTVSPGDLADLTLTPPLNWSGTLDLTLTAFTLEARGILPSQTSAGFQVTVEPVADPVVFIAFPLSGDAGSAITLGLDLKLGDETGASPGENPPETLNITLQADEPFTASSAGGELLQIETGVWQFTGTREQSDSLAITPYGVARDFDLLVSVSASDGASTGVPATVTIPVSVLGDGRTLTGSAGSDTLAGDIGADLITGGAGADILSGGLGRDLYVWQAGDTSEGIVDQITDFSIGEDLLDLSALLPDFDAATDAVSDFLALDESNGASTIQIDPNGGATFETDVVTLANTTGFDIDQLVANGTIIA